MEGIMSVLLMLAVGLICDTSAHDYECDPSIQLFQEYLRINTTSETSDFTPAVEFWKRLAAELELPISVYEYKENYPVVVITITGTDPSLHGIMLNSHMDVVPADEADGWTYPPFEAHIDENGDIYARGTQDMKSVGIQYYLAVKRLKEKNIKLLRNVYLTLMPDEEVGGEFGMVPFLASEEYKALNIGVEMDEGTSFPLDMYAVFYQDKSVWHVQIDCYGDAAHGSTFPETSSTATGKCAKVMNSMLAFRDEQYIIAARAPINDASQYTSVNLNRWNGGTANNVIPQHVSLTFDIRLSTSLSEIAFEEQLNKYTSEAGDNITISYFIKDPQTPATVIDASNPYWMAIYSAAVSMGLTLLPAIPPGATDARFVRGSGIPSFGFSPMANTPLLLHAVDEMVNAEVFLKGIDIYEQIISNLASLPAESTAAPSNYVSSTVV